jgi:general secretion pathway protein B
MSFILDALRKSETERQQQVGGEFSNVPSSSGTNQSAKWLWLLALLLLVNVAVLVGLLLRPAGVPEEATPAQQATTSVDQRLPAEPSFEEQVARARESQPPPEPGAAEPAAAQSGAVQPAPPPATSPPPQQRLMTIDELRLAGSLQLPELHLDIHVYADDAAERFVFINMSKYRENSRLDEGPVVSAITPEGVVLEHQGQRFLLPRE